MAIPSSVIEEIKYRSDIESVISSYMTLKRRGKTLVGLCPFHGEKTPSFTVYPENGSFYCFGCKVGGDVFTFTKLIENLDYIDAVRLLADRCGVTVPENGYDDSLHNLKNTIYEINRETARFYNAYLNSEQGKWAREYYASRGLTPPTIKQFGLGAAPDGWDLLLKHLKSKGYSIEDMLQANVISKSSKGSYFDRFRNRVMFPIINVRGNVIGFSGRRLGEDKKEAKYINTSETPVYKKSQNLFGLNFAKAYSQEQILLVEGNLDVVSLHQAGFRNAVAPLGTAFTEEQAHILSRYTKEIVLCFDADTAGETAVMKAFETLKNTGLSIKVLRLPDGKDPDEFLKKHKPPDFEKLIKQAVSDTEYKLLYAAGGLDTRSPEAQIKYLNSAAEILANTTDVITVDYYLSKLATDFGVSKDAIASKIDQIKKQNKTREKKREIAKVITPSVDRSDPNPERRGHEKAAKAEEAVLSILMKHPDRLAELSSALPEDRFVTSFNRRIYKAVKEALMSEQTFDLSLLGDRFSNTETGYIVRLLNDDCYVDAVDAVLKDCVKVILEESAAGEEDDWAAQMQKIADNKKGKS